MNASERRPTSVELPHRRFGWILALQVFWSFSILALAAWWGSLLYRQAGRIHALEAQIGLKALDFSEDVSRTERMILWEGGFFLVALFATSAVLIGFYWREYQRSRALHAFFASITHELKTPMASIRLQAETIAELIPESSDAGHRTGSFVSRLLSDTSRLESRIERTLELARLEGGGRVYHAPVELSPLLEKSIGEAKSIFSDRIEVSLRGEPSQTVEGDASALLTMFRNFLENSVRHSGAQPVQVEIQVSREEGWVRLDFSDNGSGSTLPEKEIGRLFARGEKSHGAGVGLYLVSELARKMGGSVSFEARPRFRVRVRLKGA